MVPTEVGFLGLWQAYPSALLRDDGKGLPAFVADQLRSAQKAGEVSRRLDPNLEATLLLALVDGLMIRTQLDPDYAATALAAVGYQLNRIFEDGHSQTPLTSRTGSNGHAEAQSSG